MSEAKPACSTSLENKKSGGVSPLWLCLVVALLVLPLDGFLSSRAQAASAIDAEQAVGQWDLLLAESNRKCRLTLRAETEGTGYRLGMSPGCRRSLPILSSIKNWVMPAGGQIDLADSSGTPMLEFMAGDNGGLLAVGPQGETYRLAAVTEADQSLGSSSAETKVPGFEIVQVASSSRHGAAVNATKPSEVAGRYFILRAGGKDTGCMLTLDDHARAGGENKASLAPACRDEGMVIFDPTGWQIVAGRLVLTARKGHTTHLDRQEDGSWAKDSQEGKALILKKM
jgi:hypothetical protein